MAGQQVAQRTPTQQIVAQVRSEEFKQQVALALPSNMRPERFVRATVTAIMQNPEVVTHPESLFNAAIKAAQDGLIPDGREAAFVMFKKDGVKQVQYLAMVGGLRKIAAKYGIRIVADVVREGDAFSWSRVPPRIEHTPLLERETEGEIVCAFAAAYDEDWRFVAAPVVMTVREIEKVRAVSRAKDSGPWKDWWDRMACKTVARRLFHELPLGDLDENEQRIVEHADADVLLPRDDRLSEDEADVAATLSGALPPADNGPDDRTPAPAPDSADARFQEALDRLKTLDAGTDWLATADKAADNLYGRPLDLLAEEELDTLTGQMTEAADGLEAHPMTPAQMGLEPQETA